MRKKIKVKMLSCRPLEENQKIFVGKKIIGFTQFGGGTCPSCANYPDDKPRKYDFIDEIILVLQDDEGNRSAVKILSVEFSHESELLLKVNIEGRN